MDAVLDFQSGIRDLATVIFEGYEAMGIVDDAQPCIEAATGKKGYYEEADKLGRVFAYYNGVRVPRRGSMEEKVTNAKGNFKRGLSDSGKKISPEAESWSPKGKGMDKNSLAYKAGKATGEAGAKAGESARAASESAKQLAKKGVEKAKSFKDSHPSIQKAHVHIESAMTMMDEFSASQQQKITATYADVSRKLSPPLLAAFNKIDPEAGVHFQRGFAVASESIKSNGVKEGFKIIQEHLADAAKVDSPNAPGDAKMRGLIAGVGAAVGGAVAIAVIAGGRAKEMGADTASKVGTKIKSLADQATQSKAYQDAKSMVDQAKESAGKMAGKAYNAINMLPTTSSDTLKTLGSLKNELIQKGRDKLTEAKINTAAAATGMLGGMIGFLNSAKEKGNNAVVAPMMSKLKAVQSSFQKQVADAYQIADPEKRMAAIRTAIDNMTQEAERLFSGVPKTVGTKQDVVPSKAAVA